MCDKETLIDYLYGELSSPEREAFDRHLATCAACRDEVTGLRVTRTHLESWAPPEPDLGFEIVRGPQKPAAPVRWWGLSPAWGFAAAAMLVGAISAAIAQVEVTTGRDGITVRTGWARGATAAPPASGNAAELERVSARLQQLEGELAAVRAQAASVEAAGAATPTTSLPANANRMPDAELVKLVRQLIAQSEERQQGMLARQILQVNRDFEIARRTDLDRVGRNMDQLQRLTVDAVQRQKAYEEHLYRVGIQR
jgi:hypothetical protein